MNIKKYTNNLIVIDNKIISHETHVGNIVGNYIEEFKYYSKTTSKHINMIFGEGFSVCVTNNKDLYSKKTLDFKVHSLYYYKVINEEYFNKLLGLYNNGGKNELKLLKIELKNIEDGEQFNKRFK